MKIYRRYISFYPEENKKFLDDEVTFLDKRIPDVPHYVVEIKKLIFEPAYSHERPRPPLFKRLCSASMEAIELFKKAKQ